MATNEHKITQELRDRIMRFINRREKAYESIRKKGYPVPEYDAKKKAIRALRNQLEASSSWSLRSHILWICAMRHLITRLLPYEFHDDCKQVQYRKHIIDLLNYCEFQLHLKPLFNSKLKAA